MSRLVLIITDGSVSRRTGLISTLRDLGRVLLSPGDGVEVRRVARGDEIVTRVDPAAAESRARAAIGTVLRGLDRALQALPGAVRWCQTQLRGEPVPHPPMWAVTLCRPDADDVTLLTLENEKWANAWARLLRREIARAVGADATTGAGADEPVRPRVDADDADGVMHAPSDGEEPDGD
ncbi:MAG: hypothetical protein IT373_16270 [Polyangiaceae bacterium]|nr:hypothetical protein [Polyangiaceae bacterium]